MQPAIKVAIPKTLLGVPPRHRFPRDRLFQIQLTFTDETGAPNQTALFLEKVTAKYAYYSTVLF